MPVNILIEMEVLKTLISPLTLAITKAAQLCIPESAKALMQSSSSIWEIVGIASCDEEGVPCEDLEGDWVDITKLFTDIQLEVARMCSEAYADTEEDQGRSWSYIMIGFRLFDAAVSAYLRQAREDLAEAIAPFDEEQGLFAKYPITNNTIH